MCLGIKDNFLAMLIECLKFMRVKCKCIPEHIRKRYNIDKIVTKDRQACIKIHKGMPGLCQAAILMHGHLKHSIEPYSCTPASETISLQQHDKHLTKFCLYVDNFDVKYQSKQDAQHLSNAVGANLMRIVDIEGANYCGLTLKQNYKLGFIDTSMLKPIPKSLK